MALTDAQAKIIAANKKKKEEEEARKLAAAMLVNAAKPKASSFPAVTPSKVVTNQVTTPLKDRSPTDQYTPKRYTATKKTTSLLSDMGSRDQSILDRLRSDSGRMYTPLDVIRDRISVGDTAQTLAYRARQYSNDDWQENLRKAAEERVARREKLESYTLSEADQNLPSARRQMIQEAKDAWAKAKETGDTEGMRRAHEKAESVRSWHGYSGGASGDEFITAQLTKGDTYHLNQLGQTELKKAMMARQKAIVEGDVQAQMKASQRIQDIRNNPNYKNKVDDVDAHGRALMSAEERLEDAARAMAGVKSVGTGVAGSLLSLAETGNQAMRNYTRDRWGHVLEANANQYEDPLLAQKARARLGESDIVDPNLPGQTLMRKSQEYAQEALDGTSGLEKFLGETALSIGQNLPGIALSMIPGAQGAGLALLGAQAAGARAWELNEQSSQAFLASQNQGGNPEDYGSVEPGEALLRGLASGGVEMLTEKIPLDNLAKILRGESGQNGLKSILKQMGIEGVEESTAYTANFLLDKIAQDPNAEWTVEEFLKNAAMGAVAGGAMAGGGTAIRGAVDAGNYTASHSDRPNERTVRSILENQEPQKPDVESGASYQQVASKLEEEAQPDEAQQVRNQAAAVLSGEEYTPPAQKAAEAPETASAKREALIAAEARIAQPAKASEAVEPPAVQSGKQAEVRRIEGIPVEVETIQTKRVTAPVVSANYLSEMSSTLGKSGSKAMQVAWDGKGNQAQYAADFIRVYNQSLTGTSTGRIQAPDSLSDAQVKAAYDAGKNDRQFSLEEAKTAAQFAPVAGKDSGLVYDDYVKAEMDTTVASEINTVAKQLGLRVQMVDSVKGGEANADIQGNLVRIEKGNPNPVRTLFGHEMTHRVQELAPESYREFRDYVMQDQANQEEVQRRVRLYASKGVTLTAEQAMDEIVADHAGALIESKDLMKRFINQNRKNTSLLGRFLTALKDLASKLTGRRKAQVNDAISLLEKAVGDAAKQAKKLEKNKKTAQTDGVRYSLDSSFAQKLDEWIKSGKKSGGYFKIGTTSEALQSIGVADYAIYWDKGKIAKIMKDHPEMTQEVIGQVPQILENPILVMQSQTVANRITLFGEITAADGNPVRVAMELRPQNKRGEIMDFAKVATAHGRHSAQVDINNSEILYVDPNKKRTDTWLEALRLQLPAGLTKYGSIGTVTYVNRDVNGNVSFASGETKTAMQAAFEKAGISYDEQTESASPTRYSLKTWNASSYVRDRDNAAKAMSDVLGISQKKAKQYIDDVNSIARIIADDQVRLDYESSPGKSSFVSNAEYGGSIDFSTICKKRRLFTGTFEAIQEALPNTALTAEEFLEIRSMMAEKGYEVSCGLCYVEGSRANMGQYTQRFIERYAATNPAYVPNMAEMNTATGQEKLRREHPEVYEAYEYFMNHYGRLKPSDKALFASQQKPKMYQMSTEYKGEVLEKFGKKNAPVKEKNDNGGLRLQSFSDFEIPHLIDSMQVIMDMSRVGLAGQAYTKVPDFAWALGDTGLKINLSLIAKGVDSKGKLILDEVEGMAEADAMALRERYSDNVGTIIVVFTDVQLRAAMADERIDYIIPFHRSQWKTDQYAAMGLPANAKDFTSWQNEAYIEPVYNKNGKKQRPENYMPNNYWNFRKSGKANAEAYLKMCAENNRRPKFHYLLDKKADGSYALKKDGSTDGYWKLLIDFKMYNNEGKGVPQKPVKPNFNMEQAERMLTEYAGSHSKFPAAQDVVDEFVTKYKEKNPDTRYSLKGEADFQELINKYGAIEQGEDPRARDIQVPKQTEEGKKVSRTVRTILEAGSTTDEMVPTIKKMVEDGEFSYEVAGDKAAIETAEATIRDKGFQAALMDWTSSLAKGEVNKQNVATGWALYDAAAQAGDAKTAADIMTRIVIHQRNAAQAVQATRILKRMSPSAQLYGIQRSVQNMQEELNTKYGDKAPNLKVPDELIERYLNAENQEQRDEAEIEIYKSIGKQMPSTFQDKWNAWRYTAMLFNLRTHIRNVSGNTFFALPVMTKNFVGVGLEGIGSVVSGGKMQKTKGVYGPELFSAAWKDYKKSEAEIMAGGKYDDSVVKRDIIQDSRTIFTGPILAPVEWIRKFNSNALQAEDGWFCKPHYANALAQYCAANGITAEQIRTGEGVSKKDLDKARAYAIKEAQKATYRDFNQFSDFIGSVGRYSGDNKVKKAFSAIVEGVLPFRKTPANILVRAVEYSPIGLASGIWELTYGVKAKKNTAAEALDRMAAGMTGTGLFALGFYLASQGLIVASGDDDEKKKSFDDLLGRQDYSIELPDGTNFTIDWLAPECIPVFMGAEFFRAKADKDATGEFGLTEFLSSMTRVTNPMLEMSCLSSLNDLLDNLSGFKAEEISSLVVVAANMAISYLTQGVPTLLGQAERASQEDRMTTYTDKNLDIPADWQYTLGKVSAKIPKWDYGQIPFIDAWGRTESEASKGKRIINNFINPAYTSKYYVDQTEAELQRLYDAVGEDFEGTILPTRADRYFNVNGERVDLSAEQYVTYAKEKGQRSYALMQKITTSSWYSSADDAVRAEVIKNAYQVANEGAKKVVFPDYVSNNNTYLKAVAAEEVGLFAGDYLYLRAITSDIVGWHYKEGHSKAGKSITNSSGYQKANAIYNSPVVLNDSQRTFMYDVLDVGKDVRKANPALVKQNVEQMRGLAAETQ